MIKKHIVNTSFFVTEQIDENRLIIEPEKPMIIVLRGKEYKVNYIDVTKKE